MRWPKPRIDFTKYKKLMLDPVFFFFAADSKYKGMDPQELKELADLFNRQLMTPSKGNIPSRKLLDPKLPGFALRSPILDRTGRA
ncbi:MAG: DUF3313 domain-containing protein [Syntrophales bacterium LBB04]|nr:DUF3313 domain-containing protein [Syntrophales bacterium LBB04]